MARKTIRIDMPTADAAATINLCKAICKQHKKLAAASPIPTKVVNMTQFEERATSADTLHSEIVELNSQLQEKMGARNLLLGMAGGQNAESTGTLIFDVRLIRDFVLPAHRGNEQALEGWGFSVVIGTAKARAAKAKPSA